MTIVTIHEATPISDRVSRVTMSVSDYSTPEALTDAIIDSTASNLVPVRGSFRWLNKERSSVVGYVAVSRPVVELTAKATAGMKLVASNMYISEEDKSLWAVQEGKNSKLLVRQSEDNVSAVVQAYRVSPRGSQPRMANIVSASVVKNDFVAYVSEGKTTAETDYGFVLTAEADGSVTVLSHLLNKEVVVRPDQVVASYEMGNTLPKLPKDVVANYKRRLKAASATDPVLSMKDYYHLAYGHAPDYLAKIIKQIEDLAAA